MYLTTRLKKSKAMVRLVRPTELTSDDLIYPIFAREDGKSFEIPSIRGEKYLSVDDAVRKCQDAVNLGIPAVLVFGVLKEKDADGSIALQKNGFHARVFKKLKKEFGDELVLISNVCLCDYTVDETCVYAEKGKVLNEKTAEMLAKIAVVHAKAGADVVAPAAMCDGQVRHMRQALDAAGLDDVAVMSYLKTDSCLFNPFFEAMSLSRSPRRGIDSSKFRADIVNEKVFMQKADLDISEGADMVIVKPALTNLDHILRVKQKHSAVPIAAYQVSGEYAMMRASSEAGYFDENILLMETLNSIKRAGADMIITYHAQEVAKLLSKKNV